MRTTLLSAVVANTTGDEYFAEKVYWKFCIQATGGTVGGTMALQQKDPNGQWIQFDSRAIAAAGNTIITYTAPMRYVRAVLGSYTNGTFTVTVEAL